MKKSVARRPKQFDVITIFPELIADYCAESLLGKAQEKNLLKINAVNLRNFAFNKHNKVDDTPYGGGPGMVMSVEPIAKALSSLKIKKGAKQKVILLSPRGTQFDQTMAKKFAKLDRLVLLCGRYEGIDERVTEHLIDEEVSVGPFVLQGGELGALTIIEAATRFIPGVLGNHQSLEQETFSLEGGEYPQYTRPEVYKKWRVPKVLLSGDHKKIKEWRAKNIKK